MSGNVFGNVFKIATFGESHGACVGCVIDGCPAGLELTVEDIQRELDRRRPGQSSVTTPRSETDTVRIGSGVFQDRTLGTPIVLIINNRDSRSEDYDHMREVYRPGHADYTYDQKFGLRDYRGGGRSSGRETAGRVAAGAVARKLLLDKLQVSICAWTEQIGNFSVKDKQYEVNAEHAQRIEESIVRCPDSGASSSMVKLLEKMKDEGDSAGGVIRCIVKGLPAGFGEPVFDRLEAELAKGMLSIGASKGFEIGKGFEAAGLRGSEHNDEFTGDGPGNISCRTNNAGGVLGGISSGEDVDFRVAFKPVSTISKSQKTVNREGEGIDFSAHGRHDPCVVPRAVPVVEAMSALVLADLYLRFAAGRVLLS